MTSVELVEFDVPRPQPASVIHFEQSVKIQSLEGRRWVLINVPPSEVWPRVRNVLNRSGVPAALADGSEGIIETVWVKFNSDEENSHRFPLSDLSRGAARQCRDIGTAQSGSAL